MEKSHNGEDKASNILCLCPNHHVMLDKGIISIEDDLNSLLGIAGVLRIAANHEIDKTNINYHRDKIYKKN